MADMCALARIQETDKATMDVEAQEDGVLAKIIVSDEKDALAGSVALR